MMKFWIFLLILLSMLHCAYIDPPIDSAIANNTEIATSNLGSRYAGMLTTRTPTVEDPFSSSGAELLLVMPSVDNRISAGEDNELIWVWAATYPHSLIGEADETVCPDEVELTFQEEHRNGAVTFIFREASSITGLSDSSSFILPVPLRDAISLSNGTELLIMDLDATIELTYERYTVPYTPRYSNFTFRGCKKGKARIDTVVFSKSFTDNLTYAVEAGDPEYLLIRPIVNEQWYKNNHFDVLVPARRQFYKAEILLGNDSFANFTLREFEVSNSTYGLHKIHSINHFDANNLSLSVFTTGLHHAPVFGDVNFSYVYAINSSYNALGVHRLRLHLHDDFLSNYSYSEEIASRTLSFGNTTEEGRYTSPFSSRPSSPFIFSDLSFYLIPLGGFILLLVFLRLRPI